MKNESIYILRMRVQNWSVSLHGGARRLVVSAPWIGRDAVVFRGTFRIRHFGQARIQDVDLYSGTMVVYPLGKRKPGGVVEVDYTNASEERGYFGVGDEEFDRLLAVALAHMSGHQSNIEIQFPLTRYSKAQSKIRLTQMSLSYGERIYFADE
jgi:hypothetical protein